MSRRPLPAAIAAALVAIAAVLLLGSSPASAQDPAEPTLAVRRVDSRDAALTVVDFTWTGDPASVADTEVLQDGKAVDHSEPVGLVPGGESGVVLVVDTSSSADGNALVTETREGAQALAAASAGRHDIAVVTAGGQSAVLRRLASSTTVDDALGRLTPSGEGALYDGVARAAGQFKNQAQMVPTIVVVTDGVADPSVSLSRATGAALEAGATVHVIALDDGDLDAGALRSLAETTGGRYLQTDDATKIGELLADVRTTLDGQYRLSFASTVDRGVSDLTLSIDDSSSSVSFVAGSVATGASALRLQGDVGDGGIDFLTNDSGKKLGILLGLVAVGLLTWSVVMIFTRDESTLESVIKQYDGYAAAAEEEADSGDRMASLAQTTIMQRAVEFTGQMAERQGLVTKTEALLERANLPLRAAEALFFYGIGVLLLTASTLLVTRSLFGAGLVLAITALTPPAVVKFIANRRRKQFESQLPDTLQLLAGTLRAGYSIMQGVEAMTQEVDEPMASELQRVVTESRLGRPLEDALDAVAERMDSKDFAWAAMAIRIQREVGGNLAELLMTVAETMRSRERLRREVKALTAEGRMSAIILGILPVAMGGIIWMINPDYMRTLLEDGFGQLLLIAGALLAGGGFLWMRKMIDIEI